MIASSPRRGPLLAALASAALALAASLPASSPAQQAEPAAAAAAPALAPVVVLAIDSIIHPVAATHLQEALAEAERLGAQAVIVELSTPGGLLTSTREMSTAMLGASMPVIVWVAPSGAQAASAGFFLLLSADVAAMAPGTNTGAAHPIGGEGQDLEGHVGAKAEQDAAANIRSLAARFGRNVELAEAAVVESRSFTAEEALEAGLVELLAPSLPRLLQSLEGRVIEKVEGEPVTLRPLDAELVRLEMPPMRRALSALAHPNIAYILFTLGFLGLYFELANPGAIVPGVVGAICLILGAFALSVLPVSYAGVALILLAMVLFIAEVKVVSFGLLTVAGIVSLVLGSMMLFRSADPALRVSRSLIAAVVASVAVAAVFLLTVVVRTHREKVTTGSEGMVGKVGVARTVLAPSGRVFVHGEIWKATSEVPLAAGERVEVIAKEGLWLRVRPAERSAVAAAEVGDAARPEEERAWNS